MTQTPTPPICPFRLFTVLNPSAARTVPWMAARSLRPVIVTVNGQTTTVAADLMRKLALQSGLLRGIVSEEAERQFPEATFASDVDGNLVATFASDADAVAWWLTHGSAVMA